MKLITIMLSYYNQTEFMKYHLKIWKEYPNHIKDKFTFFIMDDCSKVNANDALKHIDLKDIDLHIYRSKKDLYCNIAGVRNLGVKQCQTDWLVLLDMDTVINADLANSLLKLVTETKNNTTFRFNRKVLNNSEHRKNNSIHPAVCLIRKKDYWNIGGCEEQLVGHYGQTDRIFWYRAINKINIIDKKDLYLEYYPEGESDINRDTSVNAKKKKNLLKTKKFSTKFVNFEWEKIY